MTVVLSAIGFVLLLTVLVIVHELGHFTAARWSKVAVEEFGFGLPPIAKKLFTWKGTLFSLNWIPFGGFVRLRGENSLDPSVRVQEGSFAAASIPARLFVLFAGVCMNLFVAVILFTLGFWLWQWIPTYLDLSGLAAAEKRGEVSVEWGLYISEVLPGGNAESAGVAKDGVLRAVNGTVVTTVDEVLSLQNNLHSVEYTVLYRSTPSLEDRKEFDQQKMIRMSVSDGKTGVALSEFAFDIQGTSRSFVSGIQLAFRETWIVVVGTVKGVGQLLISLIQEQRVPKGIAGIVGIAQLTHHSLQEGVMVYLRLVALLSLSLAVLNVLPFPALDGGRVMFVLFEMLSGRPVNRQLEVVTNGVGILFLMALMVAVTWSDILRLLSGSSV
jgi:regulator of sigma E protease